MKKPSHPTDSTDSPGPTGANPTGAKNETSDAAAEKAARSPVGSPDRVQKPAAPEAELISFPGARARGGRTTDHLAANRSFIVRRSLLATAVGGVVPIPVMDDYLAGRVRAGMLMQIADRRKVDLLPSAAELLADPREGTAARNATMTAATLLALKLAWRKFFVLLGAGRRAEEMATTFQVGTLFDHFCAKTHVGSGVDRVTAIRIRAAIFAAIRESERAAVVGIFQEGSRILGRSIGEAPAWVTRQLQKAVDQYVASGGNPDAVPRDTDQSGAPTDIPRSGRGGGRGSDSDTGGGEGAATHGFDAGDVSSSGEQDGGSATDPEARWLDRAAAVVETRLGGVGSGYIEALMARFDLHLAREQARPPEPPPK